MNETANNIYCAVCGERMKDVDDTGVSRRYRCPSCKAEIVWIYSEQGTDVVDKSQPYDPRAEVKGVAI